MFLIYHNNGLLPFVWDGEESDGLVEAAWRQGLTEFAVEPLRHKSKRLVMRDRQGNLCAMARRLPKNPMH